jgi:peptidoglycan/LPS O-acetylase OafA/YrhL
LGVIFYHAFPEQVTGGFVGVDVFFVISGYLISSIIFRSFDRGGFSFGSFYASRINRILPALLTVLVSVYAVGWFALLPDELSQLGRHMAASLGFVQNLVLLREAGYFDTASDLKPLLHLWSLSIEEQYYIIYPLVIWAAWRAKVNIAYVILFLGALSQFSNVSRIAGHPVSTFFLPHTRFWELLLGGMIAFISMQQAAPRAGSVGKQLPLPGIAESNVVRWIDQGHIANVLGFSGLGIVAGSIIGLSSRGQFPGWWAVAPVSGACLIILGGPTSWLNKHVLSRAALVEIGKISYPLYLWHWPLLALTRIVEGGDPGPFWKCIAVGVSFPLAWLTYRLVEIPVRFRWAYPKKPAVLMAIALITGATGYWTNQQSGYPERLIGRVNNSEIFNWGSRYENPACRQQYPDFKGDFCNLQRTGLPTVLLFGDSHAMALNLGLSQALVDPKENLLNLAGSACIPFVDAKYDSSGRTLRAPYWCRDVINNILSLAESQDSIRTVILASHGAYGKRSEYENPSPSESAEYRAHLESIMQSTFLRLKAKGKRVIFIVDIPALEIDPRLCGKTRPFRLNASSEKDCSVRRRDFDEQRSDYRALLSSVFAAFPEVKVFDASSLLCTGEVCSGMQDGKILYLDKTHLSETGSVLVGTHLAVEI